MSESDLLRRVNKLETSCDQFETAVTEINTNVLLLTQTVERIVEAEEKRTQWRDRISLFVFGGVISSGVAWILRGGLSE